ncbi:hypothetical protein GMLC_28310 [Geomonas limicola]|uniref:Uncharacterized protein n=1 Tax=Geomonas limicola TaxID=2740186 RepID=A0A6V8N9J7_9BACT|nr:hypothetical protein GMLC_28310 [Geomonas limicola]
MAALVAPAGPGTLPPWTSKVSNLTALLVSATTPPVKHSAANYQSMQRVSVSQTASSGPGMGLRLDTMSNIVKK